MLFPLYRPPLSSLSSFWINIKASMLCARTCGCGYVCVCVLVHGKALMGYHKYHKYLNGPHESNSFQCKVVGRIIGWLGLYYIIIWCPCSVHTDSPPPIRLPPHTSTVWRTYTIDSLVLRLVNNSYVCAVCVCMWHMCKFTWEICLVYLVFGYPVSIGIIKTCMPRNAYKHSQTHNAISPTIILHNFQIQSWSLSLSLYKTCATCMRASECVIMFCSNLQTISSSVNIITVHEFYWPKCWISIDPKRKLMVGFSSSSSSCVWGSVCLFFFFAISQPQLVGIFTYMCATQILPLHSTKFSMRHMVMW